MTKIKDVISDLETTIKEKTLKVDQLKRLAKLYPKLKISVGRWERERFYTDEILSHSDLESYVRLACRRCSPSHEDRLLDPYLRIKEEGFPIDEIYLSSHGIQMGISSTGFRYIPYEQVFEKLQKEGYTEEFLQKYLPSPLPPIEETYNND